ncbi:hypothetical protein ACFWM1_19800 [Nocardia sp. NPDC058379]|uniref:hypothetical protein n=1 Tax=unclassified Nocardia TaxID=2637762 RepID=UPI0036605E23
MTDPDQTDAQGAGEATDDDGLREEPEIVPGSAPQAVGSALEVDSTESALSELNDPDVVHLDRDQARDVAGQAFDKTEQAADRTPKPALPVAAAVLAGVVVWLIARRRRRS